jgi:hypothetical protein
MPSRPSRSLTDMVLALADAGVALDRLPAVLTRLDA